MLNLKKIAITGGAASGKTTVCQLFKKLGAYVVSSDAIVHKLLDPKTDLGQQIIRQLGPDVVEQGRFCRAKLAEKVFQDTKLLAQLEALLHPAVLKEIQILYKEACEEGRYNLFVVEIPLLFEIKADHFYDIIITVTADENTAKKRFEQAGFLESEYERRMKRQLPLKEKEARSDFIIRNNGSLDELEKQVKQLHKTIYQQ